MFRSRTFPDGQVEPGKADVLANMSQRLATDETRQRQEAAFWIEELTGIALPTDTCEVRGCYSAGLFAQCASRVRNGHLTPLQPEIQAFRAKLRDGVILCKLVNVIAPGTIARVRRTPDPCWLILAVGSFRSPQMRFPSTNLRSARRTRHSRASLKARGGSPGPARTVRLRTSPHVLFSAFC